MVEWSFWAWHHHDRGRRCYPEQTIDCAVLEFAPHGGEDWVASGVAVRDLRLHLLLLPRCLDGNGGLSWHLWGVNIRS